MSTITFSVGAAPAPETVMFRHALERLAAASQRAETAVRHVLKTTGIEQNSQIDEAEKALAAYSDEMALFESEIERIRDLKDQKNTLTDHWETMTGELLASLGKTSPESLEQRFAESTSGGRSIDRSNIEQIAGNLSALFRPSMQHAVTRTLPISTKKMTRTVKTLRLEDVRLMSDADVRNTFKSMTEKTGGRDGGTGNDGMVEPGHTAIAGLAQELGYDPLVIYNYVRNTIEYEPYPGFRKDPVSLVHGGKANEMDTAALTLALLRASGVTCYMAVADVVIPAELFLGWIGFPYPTAEDIPDDDTRNNETFNILYDGASFLNSIYGLDINGRNKSSVTNSADGRHTATVNGHWFVVAKIDYIPSRGANRPAFETPTPSWNPTPAGTCPSADYAGADTWIPLDTSFKQYDLHYVGNLNSPVAGDTFETVMEMYAGGGATDDHSDAVDMLMKDCLDAISGSSQGDPSALFNALPGKKQTIHTVDYLPNTLPYRVVADTLDPDTGDEILTGDTEYQELVITLSPNKKPMPTQGTEPITDGETYPFNLNDLQAGQLTVRFVPDLSAPENAFYVTELYGGIQNLFESTDPGGVIGRPRLYLSGQLVESAAPQLPDDGYILSEYYVYFSVKDTHGTWKYVENKANYGDLYAIVPFTQAADDDLDMELVDTLNGQIKDGLVSGDQMPRIDAADGLWNIDYWSQYLHLQGRHYFKQQFYSEEIIAGMLGGRTIRDTSIIRVGITMDGMRIGGTSQSILVSGLSSFCDLDLYSYGYLLPGSDDMANDLTALASSSAEHELFYRETECHDCIISAAKILQEADDNVMTLEDTSNWETKFDYPYFDDLGYPLLVDALSAHLLLSYFPSDEDPQYAVDCPKSLFEFDCIMPNSDGNHRKWVGTGYRVRDTINGSTGYMIYGAYFNADRSRDAQPLIAREYGGGLGLTGTPMFFDNLFGFELEAVCIQQQNLSRSEVNDVFRNQWQNEFFHWVTLGTAKEFRWRFRSYTFKASNYRRLCADAYCIYGRPWVRVLIWDGPGRLCANDAPYLVTLFRSDSDPIECVNLYNAANGYALDPFAQRPEPVQCEPWTDPDSGKGIQIEWFNYNPWNESEYEPSNLPSWDWPLDIPGFSTHPWLTAFFGADTASLELFKSVSPRVYEQYYIYGVTTPTPGAPEEVGQAHCDGFLAHLGAPLSVPDAPDYSNKWSFCHYICRGGTDIRDAVATWVPYCDPKDWSGGLTSLGETVFGEGYNADPLFQAWNFDTDYAEPRPSWWVHLQDLREGCNLYSFWGHTTYCESDVPDPLTGLCPLDGCTVLIEYCGEDSYSDCLETPVPSTYHPNHAIATARLVRNTDPETMEEMPFIAKFDVNCFGKDGWYKIVPFHTNGDGKIDYAIEDSNPPDELVPFGMPIHVGGEGAEPFVPVTFDPHGEIYLTRMSVEPCITATPIPGAYLQNDSYIPDHFRKDAYDANHPHQDVSFGDSVDLVTGRLDIAVPVISIPIVDGGSLTVNRFYNSNLLKRFGNTLPDLAVRDDGGLGLGWDIHLGKVVVSRGDLPLIYAPDGSVRTAYFEGANGIPDDFDFTGPYYTRDGWKLTFSGSPDIHDPSVTARFISPDGTVFNCTQKKNEFNGMCPHGECDDWQYTWLVTEIRAMDEVILATVNYTIVEDHYDPFMTTPPPTPGGPGDDYYREIPVIESIECKNPAGTPVTIDFTSEFDDADLQNPDAPPRIVSVNLNGSSPLVAFSYQTSSLGERHPLLESVTHLSGVGNQIMARDLTTSYGYWGGEIDTIGPGSNTGLLGVTHLPTGGLIQYTYGVQMFSVNEYSSADPETHTTAYNAVAGRTEMADSSLTRMVFMRPDTVAAGALFESVVGEHAGLSQTPYRRNVHTLELSDTGGCRVHGSCMTDAQGGVYTGVVTVSEVQTLDLFIHPCFTPSVETYRTTSSTFSERANPAPPGQPPIPGTDRIVTTRYEYDDAGSWPFIYRFFPVSVSAFDGFSDKQLSRADYQYICLIQPDTLYSVFLMGEQIIYSDPWSGIENTYTYESSGAKMGLLTSATVNGSMQTTYGYSSNRYLNLITEPNGASTSIAVNSTGSGYSVNRTVYYDEDSITATAGFDNLGNPVSITDINQVQTDIDTDNLGRPLQISTANLYPVNMQYPNANQVISQVNNTRRSEAFFDGLGRSTQSMAVADSGAANQVIVRDSLGRVVNSSVIKKDASFPADPGGSTDNPGYYDITRDIYDRPVSIHDPVAPSQGKDALLPTTINYTPFSRSVTDPDSDTTTYRYDAAGRLIHVEMPSIPGGSAVTDYEYDWLGNLLRMEQSETADDQRQTREFLYDDYGRLIYENHPEEGATRYYYSELGYQLLEEVVYGDGSYKKIEGYDYLNRPGYEEYHSAASGHPIEKTKVFYYDGDLPDDVTFTVPELPGEPKHTGYLSAVVTRLPDNTIESALIVPGYSIEGKPLAKIQVIPGSPQIEMTVLFGYDYNSQNGTAYGDLTTLICSGRIDYESEPDIVIDPVTVQYDHRAGSGTLDTVLLQSGVADPQEILTHAVHDVFGGMLTMGFANGISLSTIYNEGNIVTERNEGALPFRYQYAPDNQISAITVNNSSTAYRYDAWNRLLSAETTEGSDKDKYEYEYDRLNNMTSSTYRINDEIEETIQYNYAPNRYLGGCGTSPTDWAIYEYDEVRYPEWRVTADGSTISFRTGYAMCRNAGAGSAVLFGGEDISGSYLNDTFFYENGTWAEVAAGEPKARRDHAMAFHPGLGGVVLFGGEGTYGNLEDTMYLNGDNIWREMAAQVTPGHASNPAMCTYDDTVFLVAGEKSYVLEEQSDGWQWVVVSDTAPGKSLRSIEWFRQTNEIILVSAGQGFRFSGGVWDQVGIPAPPFTTAPSLTYDETDNSIKAAATIGHEPGIFALRQNIQNEGYEWLRVGDFPEGSLCSEMVLLSIGTIANQSDAYSFDSRGRRVADDASEYEWSSANELLSVTDAGTKDVRGSFLYDPTGKRIRTTWIDENKDIDESYRMYLGESPVMELREDGSHRIYVYGDGRLLATADYAGPDGEPEIHYYLLDHLGSTIAVLDEEGHTVWPAPGSNPDGYQKYQPYGEFASDPGSAGYTIPSFTGKFADPGTGNHYFNARYHTSDTGTTKGPMQFSSPDPVYGNLSDPLSWNRYAYCHNNPVNRIDPDGRYDIEEAAYTDGFDANTKRLKRWGKDAVLATGDAYVELAPEVAALAAHLADYSDKADWKIAISGTDVSGNEYSWWMRPIAVACCVCGSAKGFSDVTGVGKVARALPDDVIRLAEKNLTKNGLTVIGSYVAEPGKLNYIQKAKKLGASYFDVGDSWDNLVKRGLADEANLHFLDVIIDRGDEVLLSIPKNDVRPDSALAMEIKYLKEKGYKWINQWKLVKQ